MTRRVRLVIVAAISALLLGGALVYGFTAFASYQARLKAPSEASQASAPATGARVVFRNTASGAGYGMVASVALDDPRGPRSVTSIPCDRVYETKDLVCLRAERSVLTTFTAYVFARDGKQVASWPLPGVPSRTRMSDDGKLLAYTSFVTGESYGSIAFSTATRIATATGKDYGNLEQWTLTIDGQRNIAADRNFWGVTFAKDDNTFYATAATGGVTYLVKGDIAARTLTAIHTNVECPSLSPDGTRIAFKKKVGATATGPIWHLAVLDLATGREWEPPESHNLDDQVLWLNDSTLLYGIPRANATDQDVWSIAADGSAAPKLFIAHAWSPSVVRG